MRCVSLGVADRCVVVHTHDCAVVLWYRPISETRRVLCRSAPNAKAPALSLAQSAHAGAMATSAAAAAEGAAALCALAVGVEERPSLCYNQSARGCAEVLVLNLLFLMYVDSVPDLTDLGECRHNFYRRPIRVPYNCACHLWV